MVCNSNCTDIYKVTGLFDNIIAINRIEYYCDFLYRYKLLKKIANKYYDIALSPAFSREFSYSDSVIRLCKSKLKIGFSGDLSNINQWEKHISDMWYTKLIPSKTEQVMELTWNADFINHLGYKNVVAEIIEWKWFSNFLNDDLPPEFFVIFPGASTNLKMWPIERFAEIALRLNEATGWKIVITGGKGELLIGDRFVNFLEEKKLSYINLIDKTDLIDLATVIKKAKLLVGNDTSAIHLAAATRTPSVCILGGGHYGRFLPYSVPNQDTNHMFFPKVAVHKMKCFQCNWQCRYELINGVWPCIDAISIEDVWLEIETVLKEIKDRGQGRTDE